MGEGDGAGYDGQVNPIRMDEDRRLPVGDVILGDVDPTTLSEEEFKASPGLLFHGSHEPFDFDPDFDYDDPDYQDRDHGTSMTVGVGFHATDARDAQDYAAERAKYAAIGGTAEEYVAEVLPYQARCLDMREASDVSRNGSVPKDLAEQWTAFFEAERQKPERFAHVEQEHWKRHLTRIETEYAEWLKTQAEHGAPIDMQGLLAGNSQSPWPPWMKTFREFMLSQNYDGLIINQGSEKDRDRSTTVYVFYNIHKIGTYDSWKKQKARDDKEEVEKELVLG